MRQFRHLVSQSNCCLSRTTRARCFSSKYSANRIAGLRPSVWLEFSQLAAKHKPVNLGQGFPDFSPPNFLLESLQKAAKNPLDHQYPLSKGHPPLLDAIARFYSPFYGRELEPNNNISVSNGAYSCLYSITQSLINPRDEVIIIEPFYDCYINQVALCGGTLKFVPLRPIKPEPKTSQDWAIDPDELKLSFSDKTKMLIINNPNNPLGKVYSKQELELVSELCQKFDAICLSDEVSGEILKFQLELKL